MEDVTVLWVGDLNTIGRALTVVGRIRDANLIVRVVWDWHAAWVRVVVGVHRARGEDLLSGLWRVRWLLRVHENASWRCALTFLLAWEDALGALLWHGLRCRVSCPPESSAVVVHGAQEVRLDAVEASVEDVTPFAWVEAVLFTSARELLVLVDIDLPWCKSWLTRCWVLLVASATWIAAASTWITTTTAWILATAVLSTRAWIRRLLLGLARATITAAASRAAHILTILTAEWRQLGSDRLEVGVAWTGQWIVRSKLASLHVLIVVESLAQMVANVGLGLFAEHTRVIDIAVLGVLVRSSWLARTIEFNRLQVGLLLLWHDNSWRNNRLLLSVADDDRVHGVE